ncbi:MAG: response regulator [Candidatus Limivicinus sp.]
MEKLKALEGLKALVVDDDFNTCNSVTKMLLQIGMRPEWTLSGKEAVLRASQSLEFNAPFLAYIIDWRLPDMNGIEVTRRIRALENQALPGIPILAMTANAFDEDRKAEMECGMNGFLSKPLDLKDAIQVLHSIFGHGTR